MTTTRGPGPVPDAGGGRLRDLGEDECWELLAGQTVGRIAWTSPDGPAIVPVNYAVAGRSLWIRTSAYATVVRQADQSPVAVEVDRLDEDRRTGCSVVLRGTAHVRYPGDAGVGSPAVELWPAGARPLWVVVDPREVSGRRLVAAAAEPAGPA